MNLYRNPNQEALNSCFLLVCDSWAAHIFDPIGDQIEDLTDTPEESCTRTKQMFVAYWFSMVPELKSVHDINYNIQWFSKPCILVKYNSYITERCSNGQIIIDTQSSKSIQFNGNNHT